MYDVMFSICAEPAYFHVCCGIIVVCSHCSLIIFARLKFFFFYVLVLSFNFVKTLMSSPAKCMQVVLIVLGYCMSLHE